MNHLHRYFEILGLRPEASLKEARRAYRDLVRLWHPDRYCDDPRLQQRAQERLKEINEAYRIVREIVSQRGNKVSDSPFNFQQRTPSPPPPPQKPVAASNAASTSVAADKPAGRQGQAENAPTGGLFVFCTNLLLFLLILACVRLSWQKYGLSLQGCGYTVQILAIPIIFALVSNSRFGRSRRIWAGYVAALLLFTAVIAIDAVMLQKQFKDAELSPFPEDVETPGGTYIQGGGVYEPRSNLPFSPPERRSPTGPIGPVSPKMPTAPTAPAPAQPAPPMAPIGR